jgi:hypothetical protein
VNEADPEGEKVWPIFTKAYWHKAFFGTVEPIGGNDPNSNWNQHVTQGIIHPAAGRKVANDEVNGLVTVASSIPFGEEEAAGIGAEKVALGVNEFLEQFAAKGGWKTWRQWGGSNWKSKFQGVMESAKEIHFNLIEPKGSIINARTSIQRVASGGKYGATDWELFQIWKNPQWWSKITFYGKNGEVLPNPFK